MTHHSRLEKNQLVQTVDWAYNGQSIASVMSYNRTQDSRPMKWAQPVHNGSDINTGMEYFGIPDGIGDMYNHQSGKNNPCRREKHARDKANSIAWLSLGYLKAEHAASLKHVSDYCVSYYTGDSKDRVATRHHKTYILDGYIATRAIDYVIKYTDKVCPECLSSLKYSATPEAHKASCTSKLDGRTRDMDKTLDVHIDANTVIWYDGIYSDTTGTEYEHNSYSLPEYTMPNCKHSLPLDDTSAWINPNNGGFGVSGLETVKATMPVPDNDYDGPLSQANLDITSLNARLDASRAILDSMK